MAHSTSSSKSNIGVEQALTEDIESGISNYRTCPFNSTISAEITGLDKTPLDRCHHLLQYLSNLITRR